MRSRTVVVIILLVLVLAWCDTAQSAKVNILKVVRPAGNFPAFSTTVNNATAVQHLYNLAYTLPPGPHDSSCPADTGTVYNLTFLNGTTSVQTMVLEATGCQVLSIGNNSQGRTPMYARATSVQVAPEKMEEAIRIAHESIFPAIRQQQGFLGFTDLIDRATGNVLLITRFETEADMQAGLSNGFVQQQLAKLVPLLVGTAKSDFYEVLFHE